MSNLGASRLARVLVNVADEAVSRGRIEYLELGRIEADRSLRPDHLSVSIPRTGYLVSRRVYPQLIPGDRVLIGWVNRGSDPIVIDVVVSSHV